jgi:hypothetical protein
LVSTRRAADNYALDASLNGDDSGSSSGVPLRWSFLPQLLRERHSYATVGAGKWHMGYFDRRRLPGARGFERWLGYLGGAEDYYWHNYTSRACGFGVADLWRADAGPGSGGFVNDSTLFPCFSPFLYTDFLVQHIL